MIVRRFPVICGLSLLFSTGACETSSDSAPGADAVSSQADATSEDAASSGGDASADAVAGAAVGGVCDDAAADICTDSDVLVTCTDGHWAVWTGSEGAEMCSCYEGQASCAIPGTGAPSSMWGIAPSAKRQRG